MFLIVSSRLDDIYALLQRMMSYLEEQQFAMLYEIRDGVNQMAGSGEIVAGSSDTDTILLMIVVFLGMIFGALMMKVFWQRIGR